MGIKFLHTKEDYNIADAKRLSNKMNYCVMVKLAMNGIALKATGDDLSCISGARALGLKETDNLQRSGLLGKKLGLYNDMSTSKKARDSMSFCDHEAYGVMVQPLENYTEEPDIVIIVSNPYNIMRIVQGYTFYYSIQHSYKMTGNQAICSESTAYSYLINDINVSVLCIGTRHTAGWKDDEMSVSFPFNRFSKIANGVMNTINIMENNHKKMIIEKKLDKNNIYDFEIEYDHNYYKKKI